MGILLLDFHFSSRLVAGAVGMWESRFGDFQGLWETRKTCFWFSSFSIARHFHSPVRLAFMPSASARSCANSFCFAFCIRRALAVSLCATRSAGSQLHGHDLGFRYRARSG